MNTFWKCPHFGLAALGLALGCSAQDASMPPAYPVTGTVVTESGKLYAGGWLEFRLDTKEDLTVKGDIAADGTFSLHTLKGSNRAEGAPAGSYEVTIIPAIGKDRKALFSTFTVPKKYQVKPGENQLEIRADPPP